MNKAKKLKKKFLYFRKLFNISRMSYNLDKSQTRDPQSIWSTGSKIKVQTSSEEVQALIRYSRISERRPLKVVGTCFAARYIHKKLLSLELLKI